MNFHLFCLGGNPMNCFILLKRALLIGAVLLSLPACLWAADPGTELPGTSDFSDQKTGSVLVFPFYTSTATPSAQNTQVTVVNHSIDSGVNLRFFFVGNDGSIVPTNPLILAASQNITFLTSDVDPGFTGFIVVVAVNASGFPINFNFLSGQANIKLATGHAASLKAEAIAAISLPAFSGATATLNFDGSAYNRMPRTLALENIKSAADGNNTLLILTRVTGNYAGGPVDKIGAVSGALYDDATTAAPFTFDGSMQFFGNQLAQTLSNTFPVTNPSFTNFIPAGRSGWLYLAANADIGLFGAVLNLNPNAGSQFMAFNGGHNLRALRLSTSNSIVIPVIPQP
jgi:hypothetical protein